ncbi:unnamed protein product [Porites evermanni]|uniref:Uncharacterized protein n=1 Tax=Porites evermanni TaxID=104178 RepID=A0ABN8M6Y6_9CNID|nr:unnamed protein product [Porites evermanni]
MSRVTLHPVLKLTKNLPALLQVTPHGWVQTQNSMLTCAIDSLCHNNTKPYEKAVASDQLYSLLKSCLLLYVYLRAWHKKVEVAKENQEERAKLIEACSL